MIEIVDFKIKPTVFSILGDKDKNLFFRLVLHFSIRK